MLLRWDSILSRFSSSRVSWFSLSSELDWLVLGSFKTNRSGHDTGNHTDRSGPVVQTHPAASHKLSLKAKKVAFSEDREATPW